MRKLSCLAAVVILLLGVVPARAWFNGGHMLVAYIAYQNLTPQTRSRVDTLLKHNPMYSSWTKGAKKKQKGLAAFLNAATWPDCIKQASCDPGYTSDGGDTPPGNPSDNQNIGYSDKLMHKYWHFVDIPFEAGSSGKPPKNPNALSEIQLLSNAIGTNEPDDIKSYDVVWLEHLVGDVHQPLHSTSRFTKNHPDGDAGGNLVAFCEKPCRDELHAFWDGLLGDKLTIAQVTQAGDKLIANGTPPGSDVADPVSWTNDSEKLAETKVYVAPISDDNDPSVTISPRPDTAYSDAALAVAQSQAALAGFRLAALLNSKLK